MVRKATRSPVRTAPEVVTAEPVSVAALPTARSQVRAVLQAIAVLDTASGTQVLRKIGIVAEDGLLLAVVWTAEGERKLGSFDADADVSESAHDIYDRATIAMQPRVAQTDAPVNVEIPSPGGTVEIVRRVLRMPPPMMSPERVKETAAAFMAEQEQVIIVVPDDTPVSYNGFRMLIKADTPTTVPKPIADLIQDSREQTKRTRHGVMLCLTCGMPAPCRCMYSPGVLEGRPMAARETIIRG